MHISGVTGPPREPNPEGQAYNSDAAVSKRVSFIRYIFRFQVRDKIWWRPTQPFRSGCH